MRWFTGTLAGAVLIASLTLTGTAARADDVMYYRGYFSAKTVEVPLEGFVYQVDPGSVQPAFYYRYRTEPIPLAPLKEAAGNTGMGVFPSPLRPNSPTVLVSPVPLPGQYWFEEPGLYAFRTHDLGWPYGNRR